MKKAYDSARKSKLPGFFEDRFFNISVESGIAMGIILNLKCWYKPASHDLEPFSKGFTDFLKPRNFPMKFNNILTMART